MTGCALCTRGRLQELDRIYVLFAMRAVPIIALRDGVDVFSLRIGFRGLQISLFGSCLARLRGGNGARCTNTTTRGRLPEWSQIDVFAMRAAPIIALREGVDVFPLRIGFRGLQNALFGS